MKEGTEELITSAKQIQSLAILLGDKGGTFKVHVVVRVKGEAYAYETVYKADRQLVDPDKPTLAEFFKLAQEGVEDVLRGKKELNAIIS